VSAQQRVVGRWQVYAPMHSYAHALMHRLLLACFGEGLLSLQCLCAEMMDSLSKTLP